MTVAVAPRRPGGKRRNTTAGKEKPKKAPKVDYGNNVKQAKVLETFE